MSSPFDHGTACFVAASVVQLLEELHSLRVVCRAVCPETLVVDASGYVRLLDLRLGKELASGEERTYTMCGSSGYLSQVLTARGSLRASSGCLISRCVASEQIPY